MATPETPSSGPWNTSAFRAPDQSPGFRLWRDFLDWQRSLNAVLRPLGLTQPQFAILAVCGWLSRNDGFTTQQQVGLLTNMDRMHISQIVSRLERDRLLKRNTGDSDSRVKKITLTAAGEVKLRAALPLVEKHDRDFTAARRKSQPLPDEAGTSSTR
ncbi:MarR family winged helix-turn-helix transcriptional regulator [Sphingorhabdus sp.]|jgi:DNA-binding MarR family transcriptional regulator|uniref:MarR family winged helix-turn-helix transcriptional regulator n=1 Tax=Sphingorhabdus sp. TaxID=1902408 RepID=UPI0037CC4A4F